MRETKLKLMNHLMSRNQTTKFTPSTNSNGWQHQQPKYFQNYGKMVRKYSLSCPSLAQGKHKTKQNLNSIIIPTDIGYYLDY